MGQKKFVVKKDSKDVVTYMEYTSRSGLNLKPKHKQNFEDMINVDEMIIINPSLIRKLIDKKCSKNFERILKMVNVIFDDDSDDTSFMIALDEIERLKKLIANKYKSYMKEEEYDIYMKKLEIIKQELEERQKYILESSLEKENAKGKSSR